MASFAALADHQLLQLLPFLSFFGLICIIFLDYSWMSFLQVPGGCQFSGWIVPGQSLRAAARLTCAEEKRLVLCAAFGPAAGASGV